MSRRHPSFVIGCMVAVCFAVVLPRISSAAPLKVACTGTSAMQGLGSTTGHHVPDELGKALGAGFDVRNFAMDGTTAISSVSTSYAATSQYKAALAFNPDIVLFWFGGNDSFKGTWDAHKGEFQADYTKLVQAFQSLPSHPKTFLVRLWVFVQMPVQQTVIANEILPIIDMIGPATGSTLIDYRKQFQSHPEYFPDGMHPNDTGTLAIGKFFADSVTTALASMADGGTDADAAVLGEGGAVEAAAPVDASADEIQPGSTTGTMVGGSGTSAAGGSGAGAGASSGTATSGSVSSGAGVSAMAGASATGAAGATPGPANSSGCSIGFVAQTSGALWFVTASLGVLLARRRRQRV
jgi:lysophospholipase L1-like esterase